MNQIYYARQITLRIFYDQASFFKVKTCSLNDIKPVQVKSADFIKTEDSFLNNERTTDFIIGGIGRVSFILIGTGVSNYLNRFKDKKDGLDHDELFTFVKLSSVKIKFFLTLQKINASMAFGSFMSIVLMICIVYKIKKDPKIFLYKKIIKK